MCRSGSTWGSYFRPLLLALLVGSAACKLSNGAVAAVVAIPITFVVICCVFWITLISCCCCARARRRRAAGGERGGEGGRAVHQLQSQSDSDGESSDLEEKSPRKSGSKGSKHAGDKFEDKNRAVDKIVARDHLEGVAKLNINKSLFEIPFDDLKVERSIGSGGSVCCFHHFRPLMCWIQNAMVFKAEWRGHLVAFKCFKLFDFLSQSKFNEFEKELTMLASVSHPNILTFYGAVLAPPRVGIVMEFCDKGDLADYVLVNENLPLARKHEILLQVANGMAYLHANKIMHRDMKLQNVLVNHHDECKICDLGLSRLAERQSEAKTMRVGTSQYMAPELVLKPVYTLKVDVYSYAIMIFEILTQDTKPYGETSTFNLEVRVATDANMRPRFKSVGDAKKYPADLIEMMHRGWDTDPDKRPSFDEIVRLLKDPDLLERCGRDEDAAVYKVATEGEPAPPAAAEEPKEEDAGPVRPPTPMKLGGFRWKGGKLDDGKAVVLTEEELSFGPEKYMLEWLNKHSFFYQESGGPRAPCRYVVWDEGTSNYRSNLYTGSKNNFPVITAKEGHVEVTDDGKMLGWFDWEGARVDVLEDGFQSAGSKAHLTWLNPACFCYGFDEGSSKGTFFFWEEERKWYRVIKVHPTEGLQYLEPADIEMPEEEDEMPEDPTSPQLGTFVEAEGKEETKITKTEVVCGGETFEILEWINPLACYIQEPAGFRYFFWNVCKGVYEMVFLPGTRHTFFVVKENKLAFSKHGHKIGKFDWNVDEGTVWLNEKIFTSCAEEWKITWVNGSCYNTSGDSIQALERRGNGSASPPVRYEYGFWNADGKYYHAIRSKRTDGYAVLAPAASSASADVVEEEGEIAEAAPPAAAAEPAEPKPKETLEARQLGEFCWTDAESGAEETLEVTDDTVVCRGEEHLVTSWPSVGVFTFAEGSKTRLCFWDLAKESYHSILWGGSLAYAPVLRQHDAEVSTKGRHEGIFNWDGSMVVVRGGEFHSAGCVWDVTWLTQTSFLTPKDYKGKKVPEGATPSAEFNYCYWDEEKEYYVSIRTFRTDGFWEAKRK